MLKENRHLAQKIDFPSSLFSVRLWCGGTLTVSEEVARWTGWILAAGQSARGSVSPRGATPELVAHLVSGVNPRLGAHTWLSLVVVGGCGGAFACCRGQPVSVEGKIWGSGAHTAHPTPLTTTPSGSMLDTSLTVSTWPTFNQDSL